MTYNPAIAIFFWVLGIAIKKVDTMVRVIPLSVHIGAQIDDVDISRPLQPREVQDIWEALLKWKVIFFRDQDLDHQKQIDFSRNFGELTPGHVVFGGDDQYPEIYSVAKFRAANSNPTTPALRPWSGWHTDITAAINPPAASILRGDIVPPYGGDTQWTNLAAAYNALSPALQCFLEGLKGRHSFPKKYGEFVDSNMIISNHPLVRVHPETGERVLYVSPGFLKSIVGLAPQESIKIQEMLWEHAVRPEFTIRFKWEPGSVAFWDNRSTAHLAPRDIYDVDFERQFYRVTLVGDVPVGVDGQPSESIEGDMIVSV